MDRLTIARYVSPNPVLLWMHELDALKTGYGATDVVPDGPPAARPRLGGRAQTAPPSRLARARAVAG